MPLIPKPNYNQIFASQAPDIDKPAVFNNYPGGWGVESRPNNGKPTIKGFNYLQQTSDLKDLWILQNGACLPYDETIEYAEGAPVLKDGVIQYKTANGFSPAISEKPYTLNYFSEGTSYPLNARIMIDSGDIVKSTINGNTNDPNVDMTGWVNFGNGGAVESIADLLAIPNPFIGMRVYVKSVNATYVYKPASNAIKVSNWELQNNKIIYTSQLNISEGVDCSATLNRVASYLVGVGGGEIVLDSNIKATDVLLIGRNLTYNLNGFTVMGGGIGTNDLFKTARLENGVLVSNVLDELAVPSLVFDWGLKNGRIQDCNIALETNLATDNSNTENISFSQVSTTHKFRNSFYSSYRNLMSRSVSGVHYDLAVNVNANNFTNVSVVGGGKVDAGIAYKFTSPVSAVNLTNVNAESVQTGIKSTGQLSAFTIQSGYYENSTTAIDLSNGVGKYGVAIRGNYFNDVDVAINLNQVFHGVVDQSNYFVNCTKWVVCTDNSTQADVHIIDQNHDTNVWNYVLPEQYEITGKRVKTHGRDIIYNGSTGELSASRPVWRGIIDQHYSGNIGVTIEGEVPFCRTTKVFDAGTTGAFDITINTNITYSEFVMYAFKFKVQDNDGVHTFSGIFAGLDALNIVKSDSAKTIVATNNSGMIRLTISKLNHPTGEGSCTGRVHII